jgi:hypothetical protein
MPRSLRKRKSADTQGTEQTDAPAAEELPIADQSRDEKNPAAVALGRLGGKKGGKARAEKLTPEQRSEIAKKAADARWRKRKS